MGDLVHDLRHAWRQLRRSGAFTMTVVLTLALGIGLNAAIFTMVDSILLRPLGYHDADRIYSLNTRMLTDRDSFAKIGGGDYTDLTHSVSSLAAAAYYNGGQAGLQAAGRTIYTDIALVSPQFGTVMGVEPLAGRSFLSDASAPVTDPQEALVSSTFARQNFGSAAAALGQTIKSFGKLRVIVGVMPDGFSFPGKTQVWIEAATAPELANRTAYNQRAVGKVKAGVSLATLNAEMTTLARQLAKAYPEDKNKTLEAVPLQNQIVGAIRPTLRLLMGSVIVVLLIVCANITHLQLVRGTRLRREITIRTALGATRSALARRAALEVLLLAVGGCVAGVLIALPALKLLVQLAPPEIPRLGDVHLNLDVVAFSFAVSLVTMSATALLPLWRSWRIDPASAMKQDSARGMETRSSGRLRQGLIIGEVALTLMLSVAALLLVRQLIAESKQDLGFAPERLVMLDTHRTSAVAAAISAMPALQGPPDQTIQDKLQAAEQTDVSGLNSLVESLRAVPGVTSVAAASGAPMSAGISDVDYAVHGVSEFTPDAVGLPGANILAMTPDYFSTMGIPVVKGRGITDADRAGSAPVIVISEAVARQSFAGQDPIGKQLMCGYDMESMQWMTIVGVVGDVRQDSPASAPKPTLYVPMAQHGMRASDVQLMVRTRVDAPVMVATLNRYMKEKFPATAVQATTMRESVGESERAQHFRTMLFGCFAGISILLAMIGMYGVTAYTVAQRRFEFALRFALGARRGQVLAGVMRRSLTVAVIGVLCGAGLSLTLMRVAGSLFGAMPVFDGVAYALAVVGVLVIALAATLGPAYRAASVEPMQVLRNE